MIGGAESREYLLLSDVGEDTLLSTDDGLYTANAEQAVSRAHPAPASAFTTPERRHTPGTPTVASACAALGCEASQMIKNVLYEAEALNGDQTSTRPVLVSLRGDHGVNPVKLWNAVSARVDGTLTALEVADTEHWAENLPLGHIAPDLPDSADRRFLRLCDGAAAQCQNFATGANKTDWRERHLAQQFLGLGLRGVLGTEPRQAPHQQEHHHGIELHPHQTGGRRRGGGGGQQPRQQQAQGQIAQVEGGGAAAGPERPARRR